MMLFRSIAAAALLSSPVAAQHVAKVYSPAEAIAASELYKTSRSGVFEMDVQGSGRIKNVSYLNSKADYRSPDALTFQISPRVRKVLEQRYGASPEVALKGKHVVVKGAVNRVRIVNKVNGRAHSFNRWQHIVKIILEDQIVSVS